MDGTTNHQLNKGTQRAKPTLSDSQLREFLELCSANSASGMFKIRLDLSPMDVNWLKSSLNINSPDDAKKYLADFGSSDKLHELQEVADRESARLKHQAAEKRLDAQLAEDEAAAKDRRNRLAAMRDEKAQEILAENKRRQERESENITPTSVTADGNSPHYSPSKHFPPLPKASDTLEEDTGWTLPDDVTADNFFVWITNYGFTFLRDRFNISNTDIRREADSLGLKINWDLVRR